MHADIYVYMKGTFMDRAETYTHAHTHAYMRHDRKANGSMITSTEKKLQMLGLSTEVDHSEAPEVKSAAATKVNTLR